MRSLHRIALAAALLGSSLAHSAASSATGYYRMPTLAGDSLVFVAEGDLWQVGTQGGQATRITTHAGLETSPSLSPDGRWLAFVGQYDGAKGAGLGDVYLMPTSGGVPKRLSWAGRGVRVWGFAASGEIIYTAPSQSGQPGTQLYAVSPETGAQRVLPVDSAADGALSADGKQLYFTRHGLRGDNAKHYRGGAIARLWVMDLAGNAEARLFIKEGNNDRRPMPYRTADGKARVAFLSDRDGSFNIWSVDASPGNFGGDLRQHSRALGWDVRDASIDSTRVAYSLGADLHLIDLASNADRTVPVTLAGDFDQQRERFIAKPQDFFGDTALSPDGKRVVFNVRGHLATQGTGELRRAALPQPGDGRCRQAAFSSDSKSVFALCDFSGEVEVWQFAANGLKAPEQITANAEILRNVILPSPDGRWLAHADKNGRLYLTDLKDAKHATRRIDVAAEGHDFGDFAWSPDGKALAFSRAGAVVERNQLFLYSVTEDRVVALTTNRFESGAPAFSPDGHWLFFVSNRDFKVGPQGSPWGDRNMGPSFDKRGRIYALALQAGQRWPFAAPDELQAAKKEDKNEEGKDEKKDDKKDDKNDSKADAKKDEKKALPAIDLAGLEQRLFEVPLPGGNYSQLRTDGKRLWWLEKGESPRALQLKSLAISNEGGQPESLSGDVRDFDLSADGKKLMLVRGEGVAEIFIVEAGPKLPSELARSRVKWNDWQIATDPKSEWLQMFNDAWRMQRDFFFDAKMRGVDWKAMRSKYEPLAHRVTDRVELGDLMGQMNSELGILHSQIGMPDLRAGEPAPTQAGLGAQFTREADGLRIARLYNTDPELPDQAGPLKAPGSDFRVGDLITAINGRSTRGVADISELLRGEAGHQVLVDYKRAEKAMQAIVKPVLATREAQLRYTDWRLQRARRVEEIGKGKLGYIHLDAMGPADIANFARQFYAQIDREGLIVDVRFNNGGSIDSWILEKLLRRAWMYWQPRTPQGGTPYPNMQQPFQGRLVVLANEETYSDGETFTEGFKRLGLGPVVGMQTSGAGVWLSDQNRLLDNGVARAAEHAQILPDGRQIIEGVGVSPDIRVDNLPRASFQGQDAQLEAGIAELQKLIAAQPLPQPKAQAFPQQPK